MALAAGTVLGIYQVRELIGAGGMGEVYRARDTTLNRDVAIKVLGELFASDPERLARFRREAQVLAALNHPHIAQVYGFDDSTGAGALVMELVAGSTLAERISEGSMTWATALPIARQIVEAIGAAHDQGIVHRDLKPANIKIREDGTVKVLDFGLARLAMPDASSVDADTAARSPTMTAAATRAGVILGTAAYMSPEQAKGKVADKRSDVWAFGAVLYEMLTGRRAFEGDDITETLAAVLRGEPDWNALPPEVPSHVRTLIQRCLTKDRRQRVGDMSTVTYVFSESLPQGPHANPADGRLPAARGAPLWHRILIPAGAALLSAGAVATALWPSMGPTPARVARFAMTPTGAQMLQVDAQSHDVAITRNGSHIVYKGGPNSTATQLFVRAVGELDPTPLATTSGAPKAPFTSPDGQWIGYFEPGPVTLKKIAITGGPPLTVCQADGASRGATWREDNSIIFATASIGTGLQLVPAAGGQPTTLTKPNRELGENDHLWPRSLPGGQAVLFTITQTTGGVDNAHIAVYDVAAGTYKVVLKGGSQAVYTPSGHLVYVAAGGLRAIAFDLQRLETTGSASPALPKVVTLPTGVAEFDVAADGTLIYLTESGATAPSRRTLVWVDRKGREEAIPGLPERAYTGTRISPDGSRVALEIADQSYDVWVWSFARSTLTRVTSDQGFDSSPVWTPDGAYLIFGSQTGGGPGSLFRQRADGSGKPERLTDSHQIQIPSQVLPNGKDIVLAQSNDPGFPAGVGALDLMLLTMGTREARPLLETPAVQGHGLVSPDGRWIAYQSTESGQSDIFVGPFPDVSAGRIQVSSGGGAQPQWARNGRELFYTRIDGALMSVAVTPGASWSAGVARMIFERPYYFRGGGSPTFDVSADGSRFLMIKHADPGDSGASAPTIVIVQNWTEELKRLVPTMR